jgi:antirestriction protein ArdC
MNVNEIITSKIVDSLTQGKIPWEKPWRGGFTMNAINKIPYSGVNALLTRMNEFTSPFYLTANQCKKIGASWSGHGTLITYWNFMKKQVTDSNGEIKEKSIGFLKYYLVWNIEQIKLPDNFKLPDIIETEITSIETADNWINQFNVEHSVQDKACYSPILDRISLPLRTQFNSTSAYYSTAFHECGHATGHKTRLDRNMNGFKGNSDYAYEELVAEITSAFCMNNIGMLGEIEKNTIAYCQGWSAVLKNNPSWIVKAASQADKAHKWIIGEKSSELDIDIAA